MARNPDYMARYHDTVVVKIRGRSKVLLVTDQGVMWTFLEYTCQRKFDTRGPDFQRKVARAVGLFFDFVRAHEECGSLPTDHIGQVDFLGEFVDALIEGTIRDGQDPLALYWRPQEWGVIKTALRNLNAFGDHYAKASHTEALNPLRAANFPERLAAYYQLGQQSDKSILKHLGVPKAKYAEARFARRVTGVSIPQVAMRQPPAFPRERFADLLEHGFRIREHGPFWERYNVRDLMITLLEANGGLRNCEPPHIYCDDVLPVQVALKEAGGTSRLVIAAEVRVYHPVVGHVAVKDPLSGRTATMMRYEYLEQFHGRVPRTPLFTPGPEQAGWKNPLLDFGDKHGWYMVVHWVPPETGRVFWALYQMYMEQVIPKVRNELARRSGYSGFARLDHPYLFVNTDLSKPELGKPYKKGTYAKALSRACSRIGLEVLKEAGTTPHGFRHSYGQLLKSLKVSETTIQICMHHTNPGSQAVYTMPTLDRLQRELDRGYVGLRELRASQERDLESAIAEISRVVEPVPFLSLISVD